MMPSNNNFLRGFLNLRSSSDNRPVPSSILRDDINMFSNFQDDFSNRLQYAPRSILGRNSAPAPNSSSGIYSQFSGWLDRRPRASLPDIYVPAPSDTAYPSSRSGLFYDSLRPFCQLFYDDLLFFFTYGPSLDFVIFSSLGGIAVASGVLLFRCLPSLLVPPRWVGFFATACDRLFFFMLGLSPHCFDLYAEYRNGNRGHRRPLASSFSYPILTARPHFFYQSYYLYSRVRVYVLDRWLF